MIKENITLDPPSLQIKKVELNLPVSALFEILHRLPEINNETPEDYHFSFREGHCEFIFDLNTTERKWILARVVQLPIL